jgi:hypothetical protein
MLDRLTTRAAGAAFNDGGDVVGLGDVEDHRLDRQPFGSERPDDPGDVGLLAAGHQDGDPRLGELTAGFEADAAGGASDESDTVGSGHVGLLNRCEARWPR